MGSLLHDHINEIENVLLAQSRIAANTGHPVHKGTPRENFLKNFLINHLSERVAIGQGEIFGEQSLAGEKRNQIDIVIYRRSFPRIHFDESVSGFFAESVVATIEVKSTLTKEELSKAIEAAHAVKQIPQAKYKVWHAGYQPPSILSYVVAYDGPAQIDTVSKWVGSLHQELHIPYPEFPEPDHTTVASPSLDGIFVLGKGFAQFDNSPLQWTSLTEFRAEHPEIRWIFGELERGSLLLLFLLLTTAINSMADTYLQPSAYLPDFGPFRSLWLYTK